ncbi:hypothetical protein BKA70DRAFT_1095313 [Coprinopsis sp. MPI-PUGE-AT-0042]|nr:hypothetical protein BKA70DRAFT_1095313 [Coprinopsis sp. MPI-PUGE-AT-0042]
MAPHTSANVAGRSGPGTRSQATHSQQHQQQQRGQQQYRVQGSRYHARRDEDDYEDEEDEDEEDELDPHGRGPGEEDDEEDEDEDEDEQGSGDEEDANVNRQLFVDPMMGQPLSIYVDKDVEDKEELCRLLGVHGGHVSSGYSGVQYLLVDPLKPSGQSLYRQWCGKKSKLILHARWIRECIKANRLLTYVDQWGGCKMTGEEAQAEEEERQTRERQEQEQQQQRERQQQQQQANNLTDQQVVSIIVDNVFPNGPPQAGPSQQRPHAHPTAAPVHPQYYAMAYPIPPPPVLGADPMHQHHPHAFPHHPQGYVVHAHHPQPTHVWHITPHPHAMVHHPNAAPSQMGSGAGVPQPSWVAYSTPEALQHGAYGQPPGGEYRYRESSAPQWMNPPPSAPQAPAAAAPTTQPYYEPQYEQYTDHQDTYMQQDPPAAQQHQQAPVSQPQSQMALQHPQPQIAAQASAGPSQEEMQPSLGTLEPPDRGRGRRRTRLVPTAPAIPAEDLVTRSDLPARSPTPPTRVIKSTYGGNLFTADDVFYLKKYIDYCQAQGLVLSLREICERVAVKAPHHTFYSWRRYCNKHQIRLSGYTMAQDVGAAGDDQDVEMRDDDGEQDQTEERVQPALPGVGILRPVAGPSTVRMPTASHARTNALMMNAREGEERIERSPSPPKALYRSTTGKGVAFTQEDVTFLIRYLKYKETQSASGTIDMVAFWKTIAQKAPHHSKASWMKYYRRHKHEFNRTEEDGPLPPPPEKKLRYTPGDDVLLAKWFAKAAPKQTIDEQFRQFAAAEGHQHHPWKGWQEHFRIHKAKIDHLMEKVRAGENIDDLAKPP